MAQEGSRILIAGVAGPMAAALARRLEQRDDVDYVAGLDAEPPEGLGRTEFIEGDLRSPVAARVIEAARIDTLVHLGLQTMIRQAGGRAAMKERNVIGTMQLMAAAQKAPRLRRVVVRSTTAVYGNSHRNPALLGEDAAVAPPRSGYAKDAAEVEGYTRSLARRRSDVAVTILRLANVVGATVQTPLTLYFSLPVAPTLLGYDPRLQLLHESDAVDVLEAAASEDHPGIFNVGGSGVLYLSQAIRIAGRPAIPIAKPLMPWVAGALRRAGLVDFSPDQLQFLLHGRVVDTTRLRERFGMAPRYSTRAAFERFLRERRIEPLLDRERVERFQRAAVRALADAGQVPR